MQTHTFQLVHPEIISFENYQPTAAPYTYIKGDGTTAVIVNDDAAIVISPKKPLTISPEQALMSEV